MDHGEMQPAFVSALLKKDNKRTEVDRFDILQFFGSGGFYHSKLLQSISSFATVDICKTDLIIYAQHEMVGLQYWFLLQGEVRLYSSKKSHFQYIKSGSTMQTTKDSLAELGKCEYTVQQGDFFGVESFLLSNPHAERPHSALVTKDGTIILPIQGATPMRHALNYIRFPHQYQVHTLSHWCRIAPELRSDHEVNLILHHLKGFPFFSRLPDHLGLSWAKMCVLVNVRAQTMLFRQNDPSDSMYFVIDGSCQVRIKSSIETVNAVPGCGSINLLSLEADFGECVHTFESGESFGELSLDHAKPNQIPRRTASIICVQDCVLLRVDAEAYYTLQKLGQMSRIILSQWTKPFQVVAGSRSSEIVHMLSVIMMDFKYFSFMNESTRRVLAQNMFLIKAQPGDIIFIEGEPVFNEFNSSENNSSTCQFKAPNSLRTWTTDSVCAVLCGSVGAYKMKKCTENPFHGLESYIHSNSIRKIETISDTFGQLQTTIVSGEGFGEELLHRKSSEVKRNFSYVCLEPCQLLFYGRETFAATLGPSYDLGSGKTKVIMKKPSEQRSHRDLCIVFRELAVLPFIQNFVEQDFHDFFSKAKFSTFPAFSVISNIFPKQCFGIVLSGALSVHQSDEEPGPNELKNVKDTQCHAIRLMFGACKHLVKEGDIFGEYNLKSVSENTNATPKSIPSRCTYISRMPTDIIYWDVVDLSPKLLAVSQKGVGSRSRVIQIMEKPLNQRTDDDVAVIDEFLRNFKIFCQYPDLSRIIASPAFSMQMLDASDVIFKEAEIVSHLYILLEGSIQISSKLKPEPEIFSGLSIFGEMSVDHFHSIGSRLMTCIAEEKSTRILQIPFEAFVQLEKLKMVSFYRGAKSFLCDHHCFKSLSNKSSLIEELMSGCHILCKSKNDLCYLEGRIYERSIWAVLKGSVELILNTDPEPKNSDHSVLDVKKMNAVGRTANSSAKAAFSKQSASRHSLGVLREGAAFAPFAVNNSSRKNSKLSADHDAVAAENDTVVVVFFMKHSEDESMLAMCRVEQEIAFLSQWRQCRKIAGDHAIAKSLSLSSSSPKNVMKETKSSQRYRTVRPKTGLEGKIDPGLLLPKLAGSRCVETIHNNDILEMAMNEGHLSSFCDASVEDLVSKLLEQREDDAYATLEVSKSCPSPPDHEVKKSEAGKSCNIHPRSDSSEYHPDVEKKIINIFAVDKFKRKTATPPRISSEILIDGHATVGQTNERRIVTSGLCESKSFSLSSPKSQGKDQSTSER
jgi:CRP-like cAMP-binding protein